MSPATDLLQHLTAARWFGGHRDTARIVRLHPLPWLRPPGDWPAVRQEVAEIAHPGDTGAEFYQLVISYRPHAGDPPGVLARIQDPEHGELIGTSGDEEPAAREALLAAALGRTQGNSDPDGSPPDRPQVAFRPEAGSPHADRLLSELHPGLPSQVFAGEQSNTSILYAHLALLKLFRRLDLGSNPDIEVHRALTRSGSTDVATLLGTATGAWADPETGTVRRADLGMLVEQLPDARDGWEYALARLRAGEAMDTEAERLGRTLARIHQQLRTAFGTDTTDGDALATAMTRRLDQAVEAVGALQPYRSALGRIFTALAGRRLPAQRVHGDFHLGQCLHTPQGWKIIDFEGEPLKQLSERVGADSPVRDLAGALRSFDYAGAHVPPPEGPAWADRCRSAFLDGYSSEQDHLGADTAGPEPAVLAAYLADKAVYEVVYESRHRPDWVSIPLGAVQQLARGPDPPG